MVPAGSQLSGALRMTVVARNTTVPPSLAMPPAAAAVLRVTRLPFMTRRPWLARPPPVAAEFPDTVLPMTVALVCEARDWTRESPALEGGGGGDQHALQGQHMMAVRQAERGRVERVADRAVVVGGERSDRIAVDGELDWVPGQEA